MHSAECEPIGLLLLAGAGNRLKPLTTVVSKTLLPVYDKPMVAHAVDFFQKSGIKEVVMVSNPSDLDPLNRLFENYQNNDSLSYVVQEKPRGTADAIKQSQSLIGGRPFFALWGDNAFEYNQKRSVTTPLRTQCRLHLTEVSDPENFGVVEMIQEKGIAKIVDKPENPQSNVICTGFFGFTSDVFRRIEDIKPNIKGEIDIMDVIRMYLDAQTLEYMFVHGRWMDIGVTPESLYQASTMARSTGLNKTQIYE